MRVLALSDAAIGGILGLVAVVITTAGGVLIALLQRSTKKEATTATEGVNRVADLLGEALERIDAVEEREEDCLDALQWAHGRITHLEVLAGMNPTPPPRTLRGRPPPDA